jgi:hypothetical protein
MDVDNPWQADRNSPVPLLMLSSRGTILHCEGFELTPVQRIYRPVEGNEQNFDRDCHDLLSFCHSAITSNATLSVPRDTTFTLLYKTLFSSRVLASKIPLEVEFLPLCQKLYPEPNYDAVDKDDMDNLSVLVSILLGKTVFNSIISHDIPTKSQLVTLWCCSHDAQENDKIVILLGCRVPVLFREDSTKAGDYTFGDLSISMAICMVRLSTR